MTRWRFPFRLSNNPSTNIENDNFVWLFNPFEPSDSAKDITLTVRGSKMVLAAPANVAKLSFFASMQDFIREAQPTPRGSGENRRKYWPRDSLGVKDVDVSTETPIPVVFISSANEGH
jgi:hypothetical protein